MTRQKNWNSDAPLVIAHRGASLIAPENTLTAFRLAEELRADAIEFDVKLSRDRIPVVHHDMTLDRTTEGKGRVKDHTLSDIKKLDAGYKFNQRFQGERIPTLEETLEEFSEKMLLNIELTNYNDPFDSLPEQVARCLDGIGTLGRILISSFNPFALRTSRRLMPGLRVALLLAPGTPRLMQRLLRLITPHDDLHPHYGMVTTALINGVHHKDGRVNVWTVNEYDQMRELLGVGIDGIITDDVVTALCARDMRKP